MNEDLEPAAPINRIVEDLLRVKVRELRRTARELEKLADAVWTATWEEGT